ncbi:OmpH family outer membrane protein [Tenacibaculum ovolyticum]|uniref:OmpH family outer membrane protein n=1 Tax=Tenacibaculum ovolyticum TaxID=104270 RepID=UPI0007EE0304|nr:OmpH family outer membrane protein [Tenacibaculum ovolyticum]
MKKNIWNLINTLLISSLLVAYAFLHLNEKKSIVFIDNIKAFEKFNMTNELGKLSEEKFSPKLRVYDSLVKVITVLEGDLMLKGNKVSKNERNKYINLRRNLSVKEKELEEIRMYVKNDISKKVWARLNSYIKEFGENKNIMLIMGAQGNGNIMYGDSIIDYTEKFIKYANYKYEGN